MVNLISIPRYDMDFNIIDTRVYRVTYLMGPVSKFRIVVNGYLMSGVIDIRKVDEGFKSKLLAAIGEYEHSDLTKHDKVRKELTLRMVSDVYNKYTITVIKNYLLSINKEVRRDTLTEYGLVDIWD